MRPAVGFVVRSWSGTYVWVGSETSVAAGVAVWTQLPTGPELSLAPEGFVRLSGADELSTVLSGVGLSVIPPGARRVGYPSETIPCLALSAHSASSGEALRAQQEERLIRIVAGGKPGAEILIPAEPLPVERFAARELQKYIALRISGGQERELARAVDRPLHPLDGQARSARTESGWQSAGR